MTADDKRLERLAGSVADGLAVDWEAAARDAKDEEERRLVENLRSLQSLAAASRGRRTPPAVWQGLRLREPLGHGAFGDVFAAWDPRLQREVALKLVPLEQPDLDAVALEEGRLLARVRHPHVVAVFGADVADGWAGLWMERIRGETLATVLSRAGPLRHWELALVAIDVSRALAAVHEAAILHCDIKPSNVMREEGGRAVLMDFGIGRRAGAAGAPRAGTPAFMAPETLRGEPATVRSDVYMLGALLFALGTGHPPEEETSLSLREIRSDLPPSFVRVVERALDPEPRRRWSSAEEMAVALSDAAHAPAPGRRRALWLAPLAAAVAATGLFAVWTWTPRPGGGVDPQPSPSPVADSSPSPLPSPIGPATTSTGAFARTEPFLPPVGSSERLSDATGETSNEVAPFSIRAAWRPGEPTSEIELRASRPLAVYVLREERPSRCFLLFPLPRTGGRNPLSEQTTHRLRVTATAGKWAGRLLLLASPSPLGAFEAAVERSRVPPREIEVTGIPLSEEALAELRRLEPPGTGVGASRPLFESAPPLTPHPQMVQGLWIRRLGAP